MAAMGGSVCITGAAGFLGLHLLSHLRSEGVSVTAIDIGDRMRRFAQLYAAGADRSNDRLTVADLRRESTGLLGHDVIVHLAALAHVDYSIYRPEEVIENNIGTTRVVLEAARRSGARVVLASSVEVYGGGAGKVFSEGSPSRPLSPYAASKVSVEALAAEYRSTHGLAITTLRFTNLYGPWQTPDRVIPRAISQGILGLPLVAVSGRVRDFLHVKDAVEALKLAISREFKFPTYNVSSGTGLPIDDVVQRIRSNGNELTTVPGDRGRGASLVAASRRLTEETGWRPTVPLMSGLAEVADWYTSHREWIKQYEAMLRSPLGSIETLGDYVRPLAVSDERGAIGSSSGRSRPDLWPWGDTVRTSAATATD